MQDIVVAVIVAIAAVVLATKIWQAIRRRCRPQDTQGGCGKCGKCG